MEARERIDPEDRSGTSTPPTKEIYRKSIRLSHEQLVSDKLIL